MDQFLLRNGLDSIEVLHNSCICAEGFRLCGTRGWLFEMGSPTTRRFWPGKQAA